MDRKGGGRATQNLKRETAEMLDLADLYTPMNQQFG